MNAIRKKITVKGTVQGIGFRPFIYRIASRKNLAGFVANTTNGVVIEAEGGEKNVTNLVEEIRADTPPNAEILSLDLLDLPSTGQKGFAIIPSRGNGEVSIMVSPDTAACPDCINEIFDPLDRRFGYAFNSCLDCGPRFTILHTQPFDRESTSMRDFTMCDACEREYHDPLSRRFHSQTNSCRQCGPRLWLVDNRGESVERDDPVSAAEDYLREGKVVAIRGLGGFHLAVNAEDESAVGLLRARKARPTKPFAVMSARLDDIRRYVRVSDEEAAMLASRVSPIVLLEKRGRGAIAESVAPNNSRLGVMLAYTPLHHLLLRDNFRALVMTSGNRSGEPIICSNNMAVERLAGVADFFLLHDREIVRRCDDSIVKFSGRKHIIMRRSRGYIPRPVPVGRTARAVCAYGAQLKNTVCFLEGKHAHVSGYIGDLDNLESVEYFEKTLAEMERLLTVKPEIVACDMHPDYASTRLAQERRGVKLYAIQHHHAHVVSCMAENGRTEKAIGVAFDGTGLGEDGAMWGSEFLAADAEGYTRIAHLKYFLMPGGEAVVREPWRMAVSYLYGIMRDRVGALDLDIVKNLHPRRLATLISMIRNEENCPKTSGMGRLFDAVAAMLGLCLTATYEGEGPIYLESVAAPGVRESYEFSIIDSSPCMLIDPGPVLVRILDDVRDGIGLPLISARFHNAVVNMVVEVCTRVREKTGLDTTALSGGVFQNGYLTSRLVPALGEAGFSVLTHRYLSPNDECISFGQALIANEREG